MPYLTQTLPPRGDLDYVAGQCRDMAQRRDLSSSERAAFLHVAVLLQSLMEHSADG